MKPSYKIAVIFPSRGLAFSQTCEELLDNLEGYDYNIFFSHGLSIPECFNKPLRQALRAQRYKYTHFWVVEDDMVLPKNTLKTLLEECPDKGAVACDYPLDDKGKPAVFSDPEGNIIFGGTGCLLITRSFLGAYRYLNLENLKPMPIFRTDRAWDIKEGEILEVKSRPTKGNVYGLHDINFTIDAYQRGVPVKLSSVKCGHRKIKQMGGSSTNQGQHEIEVWTKIDPKQMTGKLNKDMVEVTLNDGTVTNVPPDSSLAKNLKPKYVVFK